MLVHGAVEPEGHVDSVAICRVFPEYARGDSPEFIECGGARWVEAHMDELGRLDHMGIKCQLTYYPFPL